MGSKRKLIVGITLALVVTIALVMIYVITLKKEKDYGAKLTAALKEQEETKVQDVFSFKFARAYVFKDPYISGQDFAETYNLKISINQVKHGVSDNIQRIVFVDESGDFVHEFMCSYDDIIILEKGMVIYPETVIERKSSIQDSSLKISFQSSEYYDFDDDFN